MVQIVKPDKTEEPIIEEAKAIEGSSSKMVDVMNLAWELLSSDSDEGNESESYSASS